MLNNITLSEMKGRVFYALCLKRSNLPYKHVLKEVARDIAMYRIEQQISGNTCVIRGFKLIA